jgi:hypothetical protein
MPGRPGTDLFRAASAEKNGARSLGDDSTGGRLSSASGSTMSNPNARVACECVQAACCVKQSGMCACVCVSSFFLKATHQGAPAMARENAKRSELSAIELQETTQSGFHCHGYLHAYIHKHAHKRTHAYTHIHTHTHTHTHTHARTHTNTETHTHTHARTSTHMHALTHAAREHGLERGEQQQRTQQNRADIVAGPVSSSGEKKETKT